MRTWKQLFNKLFHSKHVTNYIHYFTDHLAHAIEAHGDIDLYNIQGGVILALKNYNSIFNYHFFFKARKIE